MASAFEEFAQAAARPAGTRVAGGRRLERIAVLGGGADARLLAALSLAEGLEVTLFSAYGQELQALRAGPGIGLRGAGPVGTYQVDQPGPSVRTTAELDAAVRGADVLFLTGPIHKQRTYAMVLADHLTDGQIVVIAPGRSLGAAETAWLLRMGGSTADITLVEAQGLPFWYRPEGAVLHLSERAPVAAATIPAGRDDILRALGPILPNLVAAGDVLGSGFADLSAAVEIPALVLGGPGLAAGGPNVPMGASPLAQNATLANLIGADQRHLIEELAGERRAVARAFGVRDLPESAAWITCFAGAPSGAGARAVPSREEARAMLRDGVIGSLVPLVCAGALAGIDLPRSHAMIALSEGILQVDIAATGRTLRGIGITAAETEQVRRSFATMTLGAR